VADLAAQILATDARISDLEARIATTFRAHPQAEIIESLPPSTARRVTALDVLGHHLGDSRLIGGPPTA